jgi:hypothetical protein
MQRRRLVMIVAAAFALAVCGHSAGAAERGARTVVSDAPAASEFSAQQRRYRVQRVRPQIYVRPARLLYRRCVGGLAVEHRLSGTVIVPYEQCWWVRG